jgi:hypothetical protein
VALERRGEVLHILMPAVDGTKDVRDFFGVAKSALPTVVLSDMRAATAESPSGQQQLLPAASYPLTAASLRQFEADFLAGKFPAGSSSARGAKGAKRQKGKKIASEL